MSTDRLKAYVEAYNISFFKCKISFMIQNFNILTIFSCTYYFFPWLKNTVPVDYEYKSKLGYRNKLILGLISYESKNVAKIDIWDVFICGDLKYTISVTNRLRLTHKWVTITHIGYHIPNGIHIFNFKLGTNIEHCIVKVYSRT